MSSVNIDKAGKRILKILREKPRNKKRSLLHVVRGIRAKADLFLDLAERNETPFYAVDAAALEKNIRDFKKAFSEHLPDCRAFYAMKANSHPLIIKAVIAHGFGLDASSGRELEAATGAGAKKILFSGPGKTEAEHGIALKHNRRVTVNLDSFGELKRLGSLAAARRKYIRAGVRIYAPDLNGWSKFGIPLDKLRNFWRAAKKYRYVRLEGIQFHLSWNRNPSRYVEIIRKLGKYIEKSFTSAERREIRFIDFGGGFFPNCAEGYYPWTAHYPGAWPGGKIISIADTYLEKTGGFRDKYYITESSPLSHFARRIAHAVDRSLKPLIKCEYYTEPGRIIANEAMHIVLKLVDCKRRDFVISDGGVNIIGWEYGESFYYPLVNLTNPSEKEMRCTVSGPLCTPHDTWGYFCYAKKMKDGDIIVVPNQGAYKYSLAQNFIKPIPEVRLLAPGVKGPLICAKRKIKKGPAQASISPAIFGRTSQGIRRSPDGTPRPRCVQAR